MARLGLAFMVDDFTMQAPGYLGYVKKALVGGALRQCRGLERSGLKFPRQDCTIAASDIQLGR
eukprot:6361911-Pyramimonas_sp.AAC.1